MDSYQKKIRPLSSYHKSSGLGLKQENDHNLQKKLHHLAKSKDWPQFRQLEREYLRLEKEFTRDPEYGTYIKKRKKSRDNRKKEMKEIENKVQSVLDDNKGMLGERYNTLKYQLE